jgi:septal ring factor EnvC (AmiA/AmiB activator)
MILRRSRPSDPRLVLGSALALVLPLGMNLTAHAQTPPTHSPAPQAPAAAAPTVPTSAPPAGDTAALKQHNRELEAARAQQRKTLQNQAKLKLEIEALGNDRRALNQELIDTAARVRDVEARIEDIRSRLQPLDDKESHYQQSLAQRRAVIVEVLAALQRAGQQPPPALLVRPEDALQAVRTAIALGALVPEMHAQAEALAGELADLAHVRKEILAEREQLSSNLDQLGRAQLRLNLLIDERQKRQAAAEAALDGERQRAADLARHVNSLQELIAQIEQGLSNLARTPRAANRAFGPGSGEPTLAALEDPGRLAPALPFADARGHLRLPINGARIHEFGDSNGAGGTQKGVSIAAQPGAQITAPCDGWVVYAGPFRSYGQLLILNAGGGYHVLLAGMERISVDLGQFVLTGEPIAVMGSGLQASAAVVTEPKQSVLYVEFRKDGVPIDPSPWWATNEGEKVRG